MAEPIKVTGVKEIKPANNENSLIIVFWNDGEIAVNTRAEIGINNSLEVYLWPER